MSHSLQFQADRSLSSFQGLPVKRETKGNLLLLIRRVHPIPVSLAIPCFVCAAPTSLYIIVYGGRRAKGVLMSCPLSSGAACVSAPQTPPWRYAVPQPASAGWDWQAALPPARQNWYLWATPEHWTGRRMPWLLTVNLGQTHAP